MVRRKKVIHLTLYPHHYDMVKQYASNMHRSKSFIIEKILKMPEDVLTNIAANTHYNQINEYKITYGFSLSDQALEKLHTLSDKLKLSKSAVIDRLIENIDKILGEHSESSVVQN